MVKVLKEGEWEEEIVTFARSKALQPHLPSSFPAAHSH
jgi:hypothetical protein